MIEERKYWVYLNPYDSFKKPFALYLQYWIYRKYRVIKGLITKFKWQGHLTTAFDFIKYKWPKARVRVEPFIDQDEAYIITRKGISPPEI